MKHSNISIFIPHLGCPFNCIFCDQYKITGSDSAVTPLSVYSTLENALKNTACPAETQIAFFGGSFTAIDQSLMTEYLKVANNFIGDGKFDSIRISTRPDCIDDNILQILKDYNVKTIELGIQSLDDNVLKLSKRGHTAKTSIDSCKAIIKNGFELGMQMMCGLPGDSEQSDIETARKIIEIGCKQVRIYPVVVIRGTELHRMYERGEYTPLTTDSAVKTCAKLFKLFKANGVTVLKIGLHAASDSVAGPFHPSFGELVRSEVFYNDVKSRISHHTPVLIKASSNFISVAKGNKKRNLQRFAEEGYKVDIVYDAEIKEDYIIKNL